MSDVLTEPAPEPAVARRRRWPLRAAALAGIVLVAVLWWAATTDPLEPGSGSYGVLSPVAPVASVDAPFAETSYVATYVEGERVTLRFPMTNLGRVPVRVTGVFPAEDRLICGWTPDRIETSASTAGYYLPFEPFWLAPDEVVDLSVSGLFGCEGRTGAQQGLSSYGGVPVQWSLAGVVPRTSRLSTGYQFSWTEDPEPYLTDVVRRDAGIQLP